jgi:hypothetical protein
LVDVVLMLLQGIKAMQEQGAQDVGQNNAAGRIGIKNIWMEA